MLLLIELTATVLLVALARVIAPTRALANPSCVRAGGLALGAGAARVSLALALALAVLFGDWTL